MIDDEAAGDDRGRDRLTRLIQAALAIYLLPALAVVLLVGFAMIAIGAMALGISRLAQLIVSVCVPNRRPEPMVTGASVYRVSGGALADRWRRHPETAARYGWPRRPETDALN